MRSYLNLLNNTVVFGQDVSNRTGVNTRAMTGGTIRHSFHDGFPLLTTKKMYWRGIVEELIWFLKGDTNVRYLKEHDVHIWDAWADTNGDLGPIYGRQWRAFGGGCDQINRAIDKLIHTPSARDIIVSAWNPNELSLMALPPCHFAFQLISRPIENGIKVLTRPGVDPQRSLDIVVTQRSADMFLGVPFNLASYGLLCYTIADQLEMSPGVLVWNGGDVHVYENHMEAVQIQLGRTPYSLPTVQFKRQVSVDSLTFDDLLLADYVHHDSLKGEVAV